MLPAQLRELAAKNARRQEVRRRQPTRLAALESAQLQGGLLIQPSDHKRDHLLSLNNIFLFGGRV
jgi:hypothetical protein